MSTLVNHVWIRVSLISGHGASFQDAVIFVINREVMMLFKR